MKRMICVTNKDVAEKLSDMGFRYMKQYLNDTEIYTFIESEDLYQLLNDKRQFSKKHWYVDKRLRF